MDAVWRALLTGTVIGAAITGLFTLLKPLVDHGVSVLQRRSKQRDERRAVVEGVVDRPCKLRIDHAQAVRENRPISYDLVLEAADSALLINDRGFAKYLARDIENTSGYEALSQWYEREGYGDGTKAAFEAARELRWEHLKTLVERASEFAVTGKWDKNWGLAAQDLAKSMDEAEAAIYG